MCHSVVEQKFGCSLINRHICDEPSMIKRGSFVRRAARSDEQNGGDDGEACGDKTAIELFLAGIRG